MAEDGDFGGIELACRFIAASCIEADWREDQVAESIDRSRPPGGQICRGAEFHDDGGAGDAIAGRKQGAVVKCSATPAAIFENAGARADARACSPLPRRPRAAFAAAAACARRPARAESRLRPARAGSA